MAAAHQGEDPVEEAARRWCRGDRQQRASLFTPNSLRFKSHSHSSFAGSLSQDEARRRALANDAERDV